MSAARQARVRARRGSRPPTGRTRDRGVGTTYLRLLRYLRPYVWPWFFGAVVAMLLFSGSTGILPFLVERVFDDIFAVKNATALRILPLMPFVRQLHAETVTPDGFRPYGQLILPSDEGIAPAQHEGSSVQPCARAKSMKPATGMLMPASCSTIAFPRTKAGNESPRVKAAQSARLGAKVLVSCW